MVCPSPLPEDADKLRFALAQLGSALSTLSAVPELHIAEYYREAITNPITLAAEAVTEALESTNARMRDSDRAVFN